jgi:hypothetical protein
MCGVDWICSGRDANSSNALELLGMIKQYLESEEWEVPVGRDQETAFAQGITGCLEIVCHTDELWVHLGQLAPVSAGLASSFVSV